MFAKLIDTASGESPCGAGSGAVRSVNHFNEGL